MTAKSIMHSLVGMTTTAFDLLTKAMRTNPDLIRSVVELDDDHPDFEHIAAPVSPLLYAATNEYYSIHLTRSAERDTVSTLCGRQVRGTGCHVTDQNHFVNCLACKAATR